MPIELLLPAGAATTGAALLCITRITRLLLQYRLTRYLVDQAVKQGTRIEPANLLQVTLWRPVTDSATATTAAIEPGQSTGEGETLGGDAGPAAC